MRDVQGRARSAQPVRAVAGRQKRVPVNAIIWLPEERRVDGVLTAVYPFRCQVGEAQMNKLRARARQLGVIEGQLVQDLFSKAMDHFLADAPPPKLSAPVVSMTPKSAEPMDPALKGAPASVQTALTALRAGVWKNRGVWEDAELLRFDGSVAERLVAHFDTAVFPPVAHIGLIADGAPRPVKSHTMAEQLMGTIATANLAGRTLFSPDEFDVGEGPFSQAKSIKALREQHRAIVLNIVPNKKGVSAPLYQIIAHPHLLAPYLTKSAPAAVTPA